MITSVAPKAIIRNDCRVIISVTYRRWRCSGSEVMWLWLAIIIKGKSQHDKTRRGLESGSVPIKRLMLAQPVSQGFFSHTRLSVAISRLLVVVTCQNHFLGESQVAGMSISVGIRIFSIVVGLGFVVDLSHGYGQWRQVGRVLRLLRRLKMLKEVWELLRS